ncbi:hypothetical protein SLITO_v1c01520 [Spiroplasma litorale]|uniref:Uncharacterized protein n=1 Tax=Spiroplasma litorale TaxID=216942 RepID=A0A0K1W0Y0_9MOLU|nr:hypothetical protein [Spiroplasma litorale]AKX33818.1 hypothetical protein SLITO_v1c01520 [Spiroplasma litorale]
MDIKQLVVVTLEDFISYLNNECFKGLSLNNESIKINMDSSKNYVENIDEVDKIVDKLNNYRQINQETLTHKNCDLKNFAKVEMNLISATSGIKKLKSLYHEFEELGFQKEKNAVNFNEKFAIKKINLSAQSLIKDFSIITDRLKKDKIYVELNDILKKIATSEDLDVIVKLSSELLLKQDQVLKLDYFIDYSILVDEYDWIHDFVKISVVNADFVNLIITIELLTNAIKDKLYVPTAIKA